MCIRDRYRTSSDLILLKSFIFVLLSTSKTSGTSSLLLHVSIHSVEYLCVCVRASVSTIDLSVCDFSPNSSTYFTTSYWSYYIFIFTSNGRQHLLTIGLHPSYSCTSFIDIYYFGIHNISL